MKKTNDERTHPTNEMFVCLFLLRTFCSHLKITCVEFGSYIALVSEIGLKKYGKEGL